MTWIYSQSSGHITCKDALEGIGYSGHGSGLDAPDAETIACVGPIPRGQWRIVEWFDNYKDKGPVVARLEPIGHDAHGRSGFLIHGDNPQLNHTASDGCIIAARIVRVNWRASKDTDLVVIR